MYYKVLNEDRSACHGGNGIWNPPGEWMTKIETLVPCESGYHVCEEKNLILWLGPTIWEVEIRGQVIHDKEKSVVQEARLIRPLKWDKLTAVKFACDCAERVLPIFETKYPDDKRPHVAINNAREWIKNPTDSNASDAATNAVYANARAVYGAARTARAAYDVADAAYDVADAAYIAGVAAERKWQTQRLLDYLYERI